jgi:hypothetical protein
MPNKCFVTVQNPADGSLSETAYDGNTGTTTGEHPSRSRGRLPRNSGASWNGNSIESDHRVNDRQRKKLRDRNILIGTQQLLIE